VSNYNDGSSTFTLHTVQPGTAAAANVDSARGNLAGTFVNAFVNAGFGNDKLMVEAEEGNSWIYKNKDHGM
jgi:26S proteasome regulatory subunit N1